ncbi:hypothetical protein SK128_010371 [Halocaridina rubra]|uniref:Uncharacterized protein n=1 Tax=Halocaridina rubra TaxID=373956 RepID=A0AAN8ZU26_HALRR
MNSKILIALCFIGLWSTVEPTIIIATTAAATSIAAGAAATAAAVGLGALAIAKGVAIGTLLSRGKRDVSGMDNEQRIQISLDIAKQIDSFGCVAKLLCELEALPDDQLTPAMATFRDIFGNPNEPGFHKRKTSRGVFDVAATFGAQMAKGNPKACDKLFNKCPLTSNDLFNMLESTFTC